MTQEEKAKRYDKVLEWATEAHKVCDGMLKEDLEHLFPELKESEDEKTRKEILDYIIKGSKSFYDVQQYGKEKFEKWIAWLEKQGEQKPKFRVGDTIKCKHDDRRFTIKSVDLDNGTYTYTQEGCGNDIDYADEEFELVEQKPADKVEPKFKVGDWLVHKDLVGVICCITKIHAPHYYLTNDNSFIKFGEEDNYRPWTIQDAKDGDVLSDGTTIFIFKDLLSDGSVMSYCNYNTDGDESDAFCPLSVNLMCSKITPATKAQRAILFGGMADAGYTFDFDKKELRKIEGEPDSGGFWEGYNTAKEIFEQKPAWSEEDEKQARQIERIVHDDGCTQKLQKK